MRDWITPNLHILWLHDQQLALGMDQDCVAAGGEGEAAAKRPNATYVCWVKAAPEQQSKTSAVFALLKEKRMWQSGIMHARGDAHAAVISKAIWSTFCAIISQLTEETQPLFETTIKSHAVSEDCDAKFTCIVTALPGKERYQLMKWGKLDEGACASGFMLGNKSSQDSHQALKTSQILTVFRKRMFDLNLAISMKKNPHSEKSPGSCGGWPSRWSSAAEDTHPEDTEQMPALFPGAPGTTLSAATGLWLGAAGAHLLANPSPHQLHGGDVAEAGFGMMSADL
ncbi:hypothetical protein IHE44_0002573 [Lamprotornis superbus]|uniref:Uncharacterized protein n=1 Tax=Lamprotornis superbus TaxID=245042 RepID=A0A835NK98_9PASS|nr:hypothetical protein IHE44_0002573 [Lamprotornis superbus]